MKIIETLGGLGNQMFIYAFGKALQKTNDDTLFFDLCWYVSNKMQRPFELQSVFPNISINIASAVQKRRVLGAQLTGIHVYALHNTIPPEDLKIVGIYVEEPSIYTPELLHVQGDAYFFGFFQDERYFANLRQEITRDFTFAPFAAGDTHNQQLAARIQSATAPVAIHIRRGDYLLCNFPLCSLAYYRAAARLIKERVPEATFFVFGEDAEWIASEFEIGYSTHYPQGQGPGTDMHLMTLCRHHIIANSSYSWWGAWLANHPDKIVVAPDNFINTQVCADWIMLPAG